MSRSRIRSGLEIAEMHDVSALRGSERRFASCQEHLTDQPMQPSNNVNALDGFGRMYDYFGRYRRLRALLRLCRSGAATPLSCG